MIKVSFKKKAVLMRAAVVWVDTLQPRKIVFNPFGIEVRREINCKLMSALVLEQAEHVVPRMQPE